MVVSKTKMLKSTMKVIVHAVFYERHKLKLAVVQKMLRTIPLTKANFKTYVFPH